MIKTTGEVTKDVVDAAFDELKFHAIISNKSIPLINNKGTQKYLHEDYIGKIRYEYLKLIESINSKYGVNFILSEIIRSGNEITLTIEYNNKELILNL